MDRKRAQRFPKYCHKKEMLNYGFLSLNLKGNAYLCDPQRQNEQENEQGNHGIRPVSQHHVVHQGRGPQQGVRHRECLSRRRGTGEELLPDGSHAQREHQFDRDEHHVCRALDVNGAETNRREL
jgi:hypothetical protein